jgi:hypothetical protein
MRTSHALDVLMGKLRFFVVIAMKPLGPSSALASKGSAVVVIASFLSGLDGLSVLQPMERTAPLFLMPWGNSNAVGLSSRTIVMEIVARPVLLRRGAPVLLNFALETVLSLNGVLSHLAANPAAPARVPEVVLLRWSLRVEVPCVPLFRRRSAAMAHNVLRGVLWEIGKKRGLVL